MEWGRRLRLLLDTHAFIWWGTKNPKLSLRATDAIAAAGEDAFVSAASVWEISTKIRRGRLQEFENASYSLAERIGLLGFSSLPVTTRHAEKAGHLDHPHKDPFDRMLIAQALDEGLVLVSNEALFDGFGVPRLW